MRYLLPVALLLVWTGPAWAHRLAADCRLRDGRVAVEAFFDDGTPAQGARVKVIDSAQRPVTEGKTDDKGTWSFPAPPPGEYTVTIDAGAGHLATRRVTIPGSPATRDTLVSSGPNREELTRVPWAKLILGVGAITLFTLAFLAARRQKKPVSSP